VRRQDVVVIDDDDDDDDVMVCYLNSTHRADRKQHLESSADRNEDNKYEDIIEITDDEEEGRIVAVQNDDIGQAEIFARTARILANLQGQNRDGQAIDAAKLGAKSTLFCGICAISCTSEETLHCHLAGAKHMKRLRGLTPAERVAASSRTGQSSSSGTATSAADHTKHSPGSGVKYACDLCDIVAGCAANFKSHIKGKRHLKNLKVVAGQQVSDVPVQAQQTADQLPPVVRDVDDDDQVARTEMLKENCTESKAPASSLLLPSGIVPSVERGPSHSPDAIPSVLSPSKSVPVPRSHLPSRAQILRCIPNAIKQDSLVLEVCPRLLPPRSRPRHVKYHLSIPALRKGSEFIILRGFL
jgi:hypothetical protein